MTETTQENLHEALQTRIKRNDRFAARLYRDYAYSKETLRNREHLLKEAMVELQAEIDRVVRVLKGEEYTTVSGYGHKFDECIKSLQHAQAIHKDAVKRARAYLKQYG